MGQSTLDDEMIPKPFPTTKEEIEAADWGDREASVAEVFDDGGMYVKFNYGGGKYAPLESSKYYVPPGASDTADETWNSWYQIRGGHRRDEKERRAIIIGRLNEKTSFWWRASDSADTSMIPVCVATESQKAIAAYLFGMHQLDVSQIAEKLDKAESTVRQYLSDYKAGRTA